MTANLHDVAERAGVSVRTVSNVVNGFTRVAPATRERVQRVIDELGYRPNMAARNLRTGRTGLIALVLPELDVPYFAELTRAVIEQAGKAGYTVVIDQTDGDPQREYDIVMNGARSAMADGLIFSPIGLGAADLRDRQSKTPIVLLGERVVDASIDHVMIDNVAAARTVTAHLIAVGRQRIAAIGIQPGEPFQTAKLRERGYVEALVAAGMTPDPELMRPTPAFHRACGASEMAQLLALPHPPDAVFCFNDLLALGALRTALSQNCRVPEDIAIAGFDDIEDGRYSTPSLTTVRPDKEQIATRAVDLLMRRIQGETHAPVEEPADFWLTVRESTRGRTRG